MSVVFKLKLRTILHGQPKADEYNYTFLTKRREEYKEAAYKKHKMLMLVLMLTADDGPKFFLTYIIDRLRK